MGRVDRQRELILPITVEFEDVDSYRIVHHAKLVAYLERARLRLLSALGFELSSFDLAPVLYDLRVRFRKPARLRDRLEVIVFVRDFDDFQVALGYRVRRGDETIARASSTIAFADLGEGTLRPMPGELRAALGAAAPGEVEGAAQPVV